MTIMDSKRYESEWPADPSDDPNVSQVLISLQSLSLCHYIISGRIPAFTPARLIAEFASVVESICLFDEVLFTKVGAFTFEYMGESVGIMSNEDEYKYFRPLKCFHPNHFVDEKNIDAPDGMIREIWEAELEKLGEPSHSFSLWEFAKIEAGYERGKEGLSVCNKETALVADIRLAGPVENNLNRQLRPALHKAMSRLEEKYMDKFREAYSTCQLVAAVPMPLLLGELLSRCQDNVSQCPEALIARLGELRGECEPMRRRFAELQQAVRMDKSAKSITELCKAVQMPAALYATGLRPDKIGWKTACDGSWLLIKLLSTGTGVGVLDILKLILSPLSELAGWDIASRDYRYMVNLATKADQSKPLDSLIRTKLNIPFGPPEIDRLARMATNA